MKIALIGYGRMGKSIETIALKKGHHIVLKVNRDHLDQLSIDHLKKADVAIDFSLPNTAFQNIKLCLDAAIPVVSGTTGWTARLSEMNDYCTHVNGAFLYAANFSIGVNIFFEINKRLATLMNAQPQYDVSMEEIHHIHKLDAPSGTALTLAEQIIDGVDRKKEWVLATATPPAPQEIAINAKRLQLTPGTHAIQYTSAVDTIDIVHTAHSRDGFAAGALLAAEWIVDKKGVFGMKDVLGL